MATMKLTIYKDSNGLLPEIEKNHIIENIDSFLTQFEKIEVSNLQYQKIQLNMMFKLNLSQIYGLPLDTSKMIYCKIEFESQKYYFFITKFEWRAQMTTLLEVYLDTLNTFNGKWSFDYKTEILRQHKERIVNPLSIQYTTSQSIGNYEGLYCNILKDNFVIYDNVYCLKQFSEIGQDDTPRYYLQLIYKNKFLSLSGEYTIIFKTDSSSFSLSINAIYTRKENTFLRNIDILSEGLSCDLYKENEYTLRENPSLDWYAIYMNQNNPDKTLNTPINIYFAPSKSMYCKVVEWVLNLDYSEFDINKFYYIFEDVKINYGGGVAYFENISPNQCFQIVRSGDALTITKIEYGNKETYQNVALPRILFNKREITIIESTEDLTTRIDADVTFIPSLRGITNTIIKNATASVGSSNLLESIDAFDRTDSRITKIIKLPYAPFKVSLENNLFLIIDSESYEFTSITIESSPDYKFYTIKLKNYNDELKQELISYNPFNNLVVYNYNPSQRVLRNDYFESKLFHSDFKTYKAVYDSFSFDIQLEKESFSNYERFSLSNMKINYYVTRNPSSTFMFIFDDYKPERFSTMDYDSILIVKRNNEESIFNNSYIDYLRNGYNYDVKSKQRQDFATWFNVGANLLNTAGQVGTAIATGGATLPFAIGSGVSLVSSFTTAINNQTQRNESFAQKQKQLKSQSSSVFGSDDVYLMTIYSENKLKIIEYSVNPIVKKQLSDLFYYCGYVDIVKGIPNTHSRMYFNFLQCNLVFDLSQQIDATMNEEIRNDIISRYQVGVTYFHKVGTEWDIKQIYENYEI